MNRRHFFLSIAGVALASRALADKPRVSPGLAAAAAHCAEVARACQRHCIAMLPTSAAMESCAKAVTDLIPAVDALAAIAPGGSRYVGELAKVVGDLAKDCKAECDKHPSMAPCKACADSCAALLAEIAKT